MHACMYVCRQVGMHACMHVIYGRVHKWRDPKMNSLQSKILFKLDDLGVPIF